MASNISSTPTQAVGQLLVGKTLTNHQGYTLTFKIEEGRLFAGVSKDNIFRQRVKVALLSDYLLGESISPRHLTFDLASRCLIIGKTGLLGGGCTASKAADREPVDNRNDQAVELTTALALSLTTPLPQVYVGAQEAFAAQAESVMACLQQNQISALQTPDTATHYFLFITDSFLKSKELLFPLIAKMSDPFFKQRLFPVIVDKSLSIFSPGSESPYMDYWSDLLEKTSHDNPDYQKIETIRENIAPSSEPFGVP